MRGCIRPMSSPMMKRMLGFCCCADAGTFASERAAAPANKPSQSFREAFMAKVLQVEWPLSPFRCDDKSGETALNLIQIKDLENASHRGVQAATSPIFQEGAWPSISASKSRTSADGVAKSDCRCPDS